MLTMAARKKAGRPRKFQNGNGARSGQAVHVYLDPQLLAAFESFRKSLDFPPKKTEVMERALREFLERNGFWPPSKGTA
jgi:hypothetical protein